MWAHRTLVAVVAPAALLVAAGCGPGEATGKAPEDLPPPAPTVLVLSGAPIPVPTPRAATTGVGVDITALGYQESQLFLGSASGLFSQAVDGTVRPVEPYFADGEAPVPVGAVRLAVQGGAGTLFVGDGGLYHPQRERLVRSPLSEALAGATIHDLVAFGDGDAAELWLATSRGVQRHAGGSLQTWELPGVTGEPQAVGHSGSLVLVAVGESVYEIDLATSTVVTRDGVGPVRRIAGLGDGAALMATPRGLLVRGTRGAYTLHTLSDSETPHGVHAVLGGPDACGYAAAEVGLLQLCVGEGPARLSEAPLAAPAMTLDAAGNLYVGSGQLLTRFASGEAPGFANDVAPFFATHCNRCHLPGRNAAAPDIDFSSYEVARDALDVVLGYIAEGIMPPPPNRRLSRSQYGVLQRWRDGGFLP